MRKHNTKQLTLITFQSAPSCIFTDINSLANKHDFTPSTVNITCANGEEEAVRYEENSMGVKLDGKTFSPTGINFNEAGLGVDCVWINKERCGVNNGVNNDGEERKNEQEKVEKEERNIGVKDFILLNVTCGTNKNSTIRTMTVAKNKEECFQNKRSSQQKKRKIEKTRIINDVNKNKKDGTDVMEYIDLHNAI